MLNKIKRGLIYRLWLYPFGKLNRLRNVKLENNIYIFAMGRGGSTILMQALNKGLSNSVTFWEPLAANCVKIPELKSKKFYLQVYIPEDNTDETFIHPFLRLFKLSQFKLSMVYHNKSLLKVPFAKHGIFKFARANLSLPWMVNRFGIKPILLTRDAYTIINSQINHHAYSSLKQNPQFAISKDTLFYEKFKDYEHIFQKSNSPEEHLAIKWALNMLVVKHEYHQKKWLSIAYEDLVKDPKASFESIKNYLNLPLDIAACVDSMQKTSLSGSSGSKSELSTEQIQRIDLILEDFGLKANSH